MGLRGPQKKTAAEQARRGNPSKRKLEILTDEAGVETAPVFDVITPEKPKWLSKAGVKQWDIIVPKLIAAGSVRALDVDVLGRYCNVTGGAIEIEIYIAKHGALISKQGGTKAQRAEMKLLREYWKEAMSLAAMLGLTPKSRQGMNINIKPPKVANEAERKKNSILGKR